MTEQPNTARPTPDANQRTRILAQLGHAVHTQRAYLAAIPRAEGLTPEDALDAAQEAFFVWVARADAADLLEPGESALRPMLTTITRNHARNQRRLHARAAASHE